jgi:hypothetical protein
MTAPKHRIRWYKQFMIDVRPWLAGITVTVLTASVVTLVGLLMIVDGGYRVAGPLVILVGLTAVVLASAFWAADRVPPGNGVAA